MSRGGGPRDLPGKPAKTAKRGLAFQAGGESRAGCGQPRSPIKNGAFAQLSAGMHALIWASSFLGYFECV